MIVTAFKKIQFKVEVAVSPFLSLGNDPSLLSQARYGYLCIAEGK